MSMMKSRNPVKLYERKGPRALKGSDGRPLRIQVSDPSASGETVYVIADNFTDNYKGIDRVGRDMRTKVLHREWRQVHLAE